MSLTGRWIDLIYRVATGDWKTRLILAPITGVFYLSLIALFIALSVITDRYLDLSRENLYPWSGVAGICLIIFGLFLMLLSISYFIRARGTPVPFNPPPKLVTAGPYRFARNPMLTGIFMQLFGLGVHLGSLSLVFFFTPLFIVINVWELKRVEEPELVKRLGREYEEYRNRVPMFLPIRLKPFGRRP